MAIKIPAVITEMEKNSSRFKKLPKFPKPLLFGKNKKGMNRSGSFPLGIYGVSMGYTIQMSN